MSDSHPLHAEALIAEGQEVVAKMQHRFRRLTAQQQAAMPPEFQECQNAIADFYRQLGLWSISPRSGRMPVLARNVAVRLNLAAEALVKAIETGGRP